MNNTTVTQASRPSVSTKRLDQASRISLLATAFVACINVEARSDVDVYQPYFTEIRSQEYHVRWQDSVGGHQAPNRAQNLRITYHQDGFTAELRDKRTYEHDWAFSVRLSAFGKGGEVSRPRAHRGFEVAEDAIASVYDNVILDYTNTPGGHASELLDFRGARRRAVARIIIGS